jgi:plasmid maintenance system killer protein
MTAVGTGGVVIKRWQKLKRFHKDYNGLEIALKDTTDQKLQDLTSVPMPAGLRFEKLKGYTAPDIYTIHVNGNYKLSMEIDGVIALLRRVGTHNEIDRLP